MKKTIKIKFVGFYPGFRYEWGNFYDILKKHYNVQVVDQDPDYVLCNIFSEKPYEYCRYPQIRILDCEENYIPDFNLVDYAITRYPITLQDRNFYLPGCVGKKERWLELAEKNRNYSSEILKEKPWFANFIASHDSENNIRGDFFKELCKYKRVESPGTYLNNMDTDIHFEWSSDDKILFQRKCKFTLCFESTAHYGFITEKISDAFYSDTIPVYYGSPTINEIFNEKAFINAGDYDSFDQVIQRIRELDQDDEKYLEMLRQPIFKDPEYPKRILKDMEDYVCHIFDQPMDQAYRRCRVLYPQFHEDYLCRMMDLEEKYHKNPILFLADKINRKLKKKSR